MTKILLPVLVGVFAGAFVVELVRRNNPELAHALKARAKKLSSALREAGRPRRVTVRRQREATWKHSG